MDEFARYAWTITKATTLGDARRVGHIGPDDASRMLLRRVESHPHQCHVFHLEGPRRALLYTGRMILAANAAMPDVLNGDEGPIFGSPLLDFGIFNGACTVRWDDHPEWTFG